MTSLLRGMMAQSLIQKQDEELSQEAVTAAVLDALSNPDVICRLCAVVSPDGGSSSDSAMVAADGK